MCVPLESFACTVSPPITATAIKEKRHSRALRALSRVPPSSAEAAALHSFYLSYGQERDTGSAGDAGSGGKVWMGDTRLEKCMLMFPQERK
jgi:acyl-coenzyme A thioesterase 9